MIIYRVQDDEGRGPWRPGFSHRWTQDRPEREMAALVPCQTQFPGVTRKALFGMTLGCGCRTIEQLRRWFTPGEYRTLLGFGYRCVKLDAGRILAQSDIQCVFERSKPLTVDVEIVELYDGTANDTGSITIKSA